MGESSWLEERALRDRRVARPNAMQGRGHRGAIFKKRSGRRVGGLAPDDDVAVCAADEGLSRGFDRPSTCARTASSTEVEHLRFGPHLRTGDSSCILRDARSSRCGVIAGPHTRRFCVS